MELKGKGLACSPLPIADSLRLKAEAQLVVPPTSQPQRLAAGAAQPAALPLLRCSPAPAERPTWAAWPSYTADLKQEVLLNASKCFNHAVVSALYCLLKILFQHQHNFTSHVLSSGLLTQEEPQGLTRCATRTTPLASDLIKYVHCGALTYMLAWMGLKTLQGNNRAEPQNLFLHYHLKNVLLRSFKMLTTIIKYKK